MLFHFLNDKRYVNRTLICLIQNLDYPGYSLSSGPFWLDAKRYDSTSDGYAKFKYNDIAETLLDNFVHFIGSFNLSYVYMCRLT